VSGSDRVGKAGVARAVEMYKLLQALDVAVVKEFLLEVRFPGAPKIMAATTELPFPQ